MCSSEGQESQGMVKAAVANRLPCRYVAVGLGPMRSCQEQVATPGMMSAGAATPRIRVPGAYHLPEGLISRVMLSRSWRAVIRGMVQLTSQVRNAHRTKTRPPVRMSPQAISHVVALRG